jgi:hypothetical protein
MKLKPKHLERLWLELDMLGENLSEIEASENLHDVREFLRRAQIDLGEALAWVDQTRTRMRAQNEKAPGNRGPRSYH